VPAGEWFCVLCKKKRAAETANEKKKKKKKSSKDKFPSPATVEEEKRPPRLFEDDDDDREAVIAQKSPPTFRLAPTPQRALALPPKDDVIDLCDDDDEDGDLVETAAPKRIPKKGSRPAVEEPRTNHQQQKARRPTLAYVPPQQNRTSRGLEDDDDDDDDVWRPPRSTVVQPLPRQQQRQRQPQQQRREESHSPRNNNNNQRSAPSQPPSQPPQPLTWPGYAAWVHDVFEYLCHNLRMLHWYAIKEAGALPQDESKHNQCVMSKRKAIVFYTKALFWSGSAHLWNKTVPAIPLCDANVVREQFCVDVDATLQEQQQKQDLLSFESIDARRHVADQITETWLRRMCGDFAALREAARKDLTCGAASEIWESTKTATERTTLNTSEKGETLLPLPRSISPPDALLTTLSYVPSGHRIQATVRKDVLDRLRARYAKTLRRKKEQRRREDVAHDHFPLPQSEDDSEEDETDRDFLARAFAMLLRYQDLARGDAGQHGVLPKPAFDVLERWGCQGECFATPFNATLDEFCSPFFDTDEAFGSHGSFFSRTFREGCYEINPPFSLRDDTVARHLADCLGDAEKHGRPLAFVLVHTGSFGRSATQNPRLRQFVRRSEELPGSLHYYYEGAFFMRATPRAYVPPNPSAAVFAMTQAATRKWPVTPKFIKNFKAAFTWPIINNLDVSHSYD